MSDQSYFSRGQDPTQSWDERAQTILQRQGWLPCDEEYSRTASALLVRFLRGHAQTDLEVLIPRARDFIERGEPFLPEPTRLWDDPARLVLHEPKPQCIWVEPERIFPSRELQDRGDWTRTENEPVEVRNDPLLGLAEFTRRIARERGETQGLRELMGTRETVAQVDLNGWHTPLGAFFRVNLNGNHRAAAFAVLGTPCITATVHWNTGPFSATTSTDHVADEVLCSYRALLHCYGVASYPDPENFVSNSEQIVSEWPFLIDSAESAVRSLALMQRIAKRRHYESIGRLPRQLFDDAEALIAAGRRTRTVLERNRRQVGIGGVRGMLRTAGILR